MENIEFVAKKLKADILRSQQGSSSVTRIVPIEELRQKLSLSEGPLAQESNPLDRFLEIYLGHATKLRDPRFMGHQVPAPAEGSVLADLIQGTTNNSSSVYDMGAAGVAIEKEMVQWMMSHFGWSEKDSGGFFTHGGSLANLTALLAARAKTQPDAWEQGNHPDLIALAPEASHYCVHRTISIMGMGSRNLWLIPTNEKGQILEDELLKLIEKAKSQGKKIFALSVNGGVTATGYYDDINRIAEIAKENKIWLHVDGAHGGSAVISPKYSQLLEGAEKADSIVWDAHKMLMCSSLCAGLLFKDKKSMDSIFQQSATYLKGDNNDEFPSLFHHSLECTKPVIALKLYMNLLLHGEAHLRQNLEGLYDRAAKFSRIIENQPEYSVPFEPQSNIILFRYKEGDRLQKKLHEEILKRGDFHITCTHWKNRTYLRLSLMNPNTQESHLMDLLNSIRNIARELS